MRLDLTSIITENGAYLDVDCTVSLGDVLFSGETISFKPAGVRGRIANNGNNLSVELQTTLQVTLQCGRCLEPYIYVLPLDIKTSARKDGSDDDFTLDGHHLELDVILKEFAFSELPIVRLCKETCKGLCYSCGKNLNEGPCGCSYREDETEEEFSFTEKLKRLTEKKK